jgi:hypothetical protein
MIKKEKKIKKMSFYGYPETAFNAMTLPDFVGKSEFEYAENLKGIPNS